MIDEYRRVAGSGTFDEAKVLEEIRAGKKLDKTTKRFYDPRVGEKPHYTATETPRGQHTVDEFPKKARDSFDEALAERDAAIKRRDKAETIRDRDRISAEVNEASRKVGDAAAAAAVKKRFPNAERLHPAPSGGGSRPGDFDQVWRVAKGDTEEFLCEPNAAEALLPLELTALVRRAARRGLAVGVRSTYLPQALLEQR